MSTPASVAAVRRVERVRARLGSRKLGWDCRDGRGHGGVEFVEARQVGGGVGAVGGFSRGVDGDQRVADDSHVGLGVVDVVP